MSGDRNSFWTRNNMFKRRIQCKPGSDLYRNTASFPTTLISHCTLPLICHHWQIFVVLLFRVYHNNYNSEALQRKNRPRKPAIWWSLVGLVDNTVTPVLKLILHLACVLFNPTFKYLKRNACRKRNNKRSFIFVFLHEFLQLWTITTNVVFVETKV